MSNRPNSFNSLGLMRASVIGAILGIVAIVTFVLLWILLGQAGAEQVPRLFVSLCVPPALIGVIILVYVLYTRSRRQQ